MSKRMDRRELLKLTSLGGVVFASGIFPGLVGCGSQTAAARAPAAPLPAASTRRGASEDFFFLQMSDTHWGFSNPKVNPHPEAELPAAIAAINAMGTKPDFVVFTGDLTHTTDDGDVRRKRMTEFKQIVSALQIPVVRFMPGEHDAALDAGKAYGEFFGDLHYSFDHKGVHFVAIDNASSPTATVGDAQIAWLKEDLARLDVNAPIVVLAHRPLWDLRADWDWTTLDGAKVMGVLMPFANVVVFFGHIHQEIHHTTGHIAHHSVRSTMFALPAPGTEGKKFQLPWDPEHPDANLGYRTVAATRTPEQYRLDEIALVTGTRQTQTVSVSAKKWSYTPDTIVLEKGVPAVLELTSEDVHHGFNLTGFHVRADVFPGRTTRLEFTPDHAGAFTFHCDFFCGEGHEDMQGTLRVE